MKRSEIRSLLVSSTLSLLTIVGAGTAGASGIVYDAAADFSAANNPNGVWSYGAQQQLGGTFTAYSRTKVESGNPTWYELDTFLIYSQVWGIEPWIAYDGVSSHLLMHPGVITYPYDLYDKLPYSVLRWTAPADGMYAVDARFFGFGFANFQPGTTTDVHVLLNNVALLDAYIVGPSAEQLFVGNRFFAAGETLDFAVGPATDVGPLYDYQGDLTGLSLSVTAVPEPATALLFCVGVAGLIGVRRGRKCAS